LPCATSAGVGVTGPSPAAAVVVAAVVVAARAVVVAGAADGRLSCPRWYPTAYAAIRSPRIAPPATRPPSSQRQRPSEVP
jgi:hypothetical protein